MSRTAYLSRKQERNIRKLERKFGKFDSSNPCDWCGPINPRFDAFMARLFDEDLAKVSREDKAAINSAIDAAAIEGKIDWPLLESLLSGFQTLRALRWMRIYTKACTPGLVLRSPSRMGEDHPAYKEAMLCKAHREAQGTPTPTETTESRPRFNVFDAVTGGMQVRPFEPGSGSTAPIAPEKTDETPKWLWAVPAALLLLLMR